MGPRHQDLMLVSTQIRNVGRLIITSAYFPYNGKSIPSTEAVKLIDYYYYIVGYLMSTELDFLNVRNTPTFHNSSRTEFIDISPCSRN